MFYRFKRGFKGLSYLFLLIITVTSCSLDANDTRGERLNMVGKEYINSGIIFRVTDKNSITIEACTQNYSKQRLNFDMVSLNGLSFNITSIEDNAFKNNKTIKELLVSSSIKRIGTEAFYGCDSLTTIMDNSSIAPRDTICERAFANCKALRTVQTGYARIEKEAFKDCSSIKIVFADSLSSLASGAFSGCSALKYFYMHNNIPLNIDSTVFENTNTSKTLCVPKGKLDAYKSTAVWKDFETINDIIEPDW